MFRTKDCKSKSHLLLFNHFGKLFGLSEEGLVSPFPDKVIHHQGHHSNTAAVHYSRRRTHLADFACKASKSWCASVSRDGTCDKKGLTSLSS